MENACAKVLAAANARPSTMASSMAMHAPWPKNGVIGWAASPRIVTRSLQYCCSGSRSRRPHFEQRPRKNRADELRSGRIKIAIEICEFLHGCGNSPSLLLPTRLTTDPNHIHDGSMTQRIMEKIPIGADEHGKGRIFSAVRHIGHRHKRTKCHLARIVHGLVSEETGTYFRGIPVTSNQDVACKCLSD